MDAEEPRLDNAEGLTLAELLAREGLSLSDVALTSELEQHLGLRIVEAGPEGVTMTMPVRAQAFNGSGNVHGGAIATLIDTAAGIAATLASTYRPHLDAIVTADLHVRYLGRAKGQTMVAVSRVLRAGKMLVVVECTVRDDLGNMVAVGDFSSMLVPHRGPLPGSTGSAAPDL